MRIRVEVELLMNNAPVDKATLDIIAEQVRHAVRNTIVEIYSKEAYGLAIASLPAKVMILGGGQWE